MAWMVYSTLGKNLAGWLSPKSGGEWSYIQLVAAWSQVVFPRAQYWGQSCLISLSDDLDEGIKAHPQ